MSPTRTSRGRPSTWIADTVRVARTQLHPNTWNVNKQNAFQYAKLLESIQEHGFLDPILARPCTVHDDLEIIGGQHRWQAAGDLVDQMPELDSLPVIIREMDDRTARKISLIDNELHGQADPKSLSALLGDLLKEDPESMLRGLPYTDEILKSLTGFTALPPLPAAPAASLGASPPLQGSGTSGEKWVERTYRMPADVAAVIDDSIAKAKEEFRRISGNPNWDTSDFQALEVIAAEYLAS